jgi:hypothetical protein
MGASAARRSGTDLETSSLPSHPKKTTWLLFYPGEGGCQVNRRIIADLYIALFSSFIVDLATISYRNSPCNIALPSPSYLFILRRAHPVFPKKKKETNQNLLAFVVIPFSLLARTTHEKTSDLCSKVSIRPLTDLFRTARPPRYSNSNHCHPPRRTVKRYLLPRLPHLAIFS